MKKFVTENGPVSKVYVHGYCFGDRILEGVMFECIIQNNQIKVLGVDSRSKSYFMQLNMPYWLAAAQKYAEDNDIFETDNNEDAWIEDSE